MQQRGALAITGGRVWVPVRRAGRRLRGLQGPRRRRPAGRRRRRRATARHPRQGGIWNPAGPPCTPPGTCWSCPRTAPTFPGDAYDHTNSVLELDVGELVDSFAPTDWAQNNQGDVGLGSQGVALVGTKWAVLGGKSGPVYVLRQGHLGGIGGQVSVTERLPVLRRRGGRRQRRLPAVHGRRPGGPRRLGRDLHVLWHASGSITGSPVIGGGPRLGPRLRRRGAARPRPGHRQDLGQVAVGKANRFATPAIYGSLRARPHPHRRGLRRTPWRPDISGGADVAGQCSGSKDSGWSACWADATKPRTNGVRAEIPSCWSFVVGQSVICAAASAPAAITLAAVIAAGGASVRCRHSS